MTALPKGKKSVKGILKGTAAEKGSKKALYPLRHKAFALNRAYTIDATVSSPVFYADIRIFHLYRQLSFIRIRIATPLSSYTFNHIGYHLIKLSSVLSRDNRLPCISFN